MYKQYGNTLIEWRGKPKALRCDNGPEYISITLATWAENKGIELLFIQPGNPSKMLILSDIIGLYVMNI